MIVFRALGFVSDRDILEHIIYDFEDPEMMEMVKPSLDEAFVIQVCNSSLVLVFAHVLYPSSWRSFNVVPDSFDLFVLKYNLKPMKPFCWECQESKGLVIGRNESLNVRLDFRRENGSCDPRACDSVTLLFFSAFLLSHPHLGTKCSSKLYWSSWSEARSDKGAAYQVCQGNSAKGIAASRWSIRFLRNEESCQWFKSFDTFFFEVSHTPRSVLYWVHGASTFAGCAGSSRTGRPRSHWEQAARPRRSAFSIPVPSAV